MSRDCIYAIHYAGHSVAESSKASVWCLSVCLLSRRACTETNAPAGSTDMASVRSTLDPNSKPDYTRYEDRKGDAKWGGLEYLGVTYPRPTNRKTCVALVAWFCPATRTQYFTGAWSA